MATHFYIQIKGLENGPMNSKELMLLAQLGRLSPTDMVRQDGSEKWVLASRIKELEFGSPQENLGDEIEEIPEIESSPNPPPLVNNSPKQQHFLINDGHSPLSGAAAKQGRIVFTLVLPCLSLLVALAALWIALFRDPLGSGISKYNFSTPRNALESYLKIQINHDMRAEIELSSLVRGKDLKEELSTLDVRKEVEFRGKKMLFVAFKEKGVNKYDILSFEKDADTGFWIRTGVGAYEVEKDNKELANQMRRWEESGELGNGK